MSDEKKLPENTTIVKMVEVAENGRDMPDMYHFIADACSDIGSELYNHEGGFTISVLMTKYEKPEPKKVAFEIKWTNKAGDTLLTFRSKRGLREAIEDATNELYEIIEIPDNGLKMKVKPIYE